MDNKQLTDTLLMIRPASFGFNHETAGNNAFQDSDGAEAVEVIRNKAIIEFDAFVVKLRKAGIKVIVIQDDDNIIKPDAIFPNNWISFHQDGSVITYPMLAANRRLERQEDYIYQISHTHRVLHRHHLESYETKGLILEGTGSLVLDRQHRMAYACLSPRTDIELLNKWCTLRSYKSCSFHAVDRDGLPIYHTNVLMTMGQHFVVICLDAVQDANEKKSLLSAFLRTQKKVIDITIDQMYAFAGNMLQVINADGIPYVIMSEQAYKSLRADQILEIEASAKILFSPIYTIEKYGGGSARCMMAEVFLPSRNQTNIQHKIQE